MTCGIYRITHIASGKYYLGSSLNTEKRLGEHLRLLRNSEHSNHHLQHAFDKYGAEAFCFEVIAECSGEERIALEQAYLSEAWGSSLLYNVNPVASLPPSTPETRAKQHAAMRATMRAKTAEEKAASAQKTVAALYAKTPEDRQRIRVKAVKTFKTTVSARTQEEKASVRASMLAVWNSRTPEERAEIATKISASLTGKKMSPEAVEKNRRSKTGKRHSQVTREKMSKAHAGVKVSQDCLEKRKAAWAAKSPEELAEIRAKMWATRRANRAAEGK